jgi:general secretion pathway protein E
MIGEMRDRASAQNALRASMTGHQVWTTVHANSALAIIDRLVDLGLPTSLVADHTVVTGLISQRLVKVLCPHCKKRLVHHQHEVSDALLARVKQAIPRDFANVCVVGPGCEECRYQGTTGRSVVAEVIIPDAQFFEYVRAGEKVRAAQYWLEDMDGKTILEHAVEKVASGLIDPRMAEKIVGYLTSGPATSPKRLNVVEAVRAV